MKGASCSLGRKYRGRTLPILAESGYHLHGFLEPRAALKNRTERGLRAYSLTLVCNKGNKAPLGASSFLIELAYNLPCLLSTGERSSNVLSKLRVGRETVEPVLPSVRNGFKSDSRRHGTPGRCDQLSRNGAHRDRSRHRSQNQ